MRSIRILILAAAAALALAAAGSAPAGVVPDMFDVPVSGTLNVQTPCTGILQLQQVQVAPDGIMVEIVGIDGVIVADRAAAAALLNETFGLIPGAGPYHWASRSRGRGEAPAAPPSTTASPPAGGGRAGRASVRPASGRSVSGGPRRCAG